MDKNKEQLKKQLLQFVKSVKEPMTKEEYDKYMEEYHKQDPLLQTGSGYLYVPSEDVVVSADSIYNFIERVIDESMMDVKMQYYKELFDKSNEEFL